MVNHQPGCPAIADDESDEVLYDCGECTCRCERCGEVPCACVLREAEDVVARFEMAPGVPVVVMVEDTETDIEFLEVPQK